MTQPRSGSLQPKIIHNLNSVAELMFRYVINSNHRDELKRVVAEIRDVYDEPNHSMLWGPVYWALGLRDRTPEIESVLDAADDNVVHFLQELVKLFENENGDWIKSNSANPTLMYKLLTCLPDYQQPGFNPRESIEQSQLIHLRDLFVFKSKNFIDAKIKAQQEREAGAIDRTKVTKLPSQHVRVVGGQLEKLINKTHVSTQSEDVKTINSEAVQHGKKVLAAFFQADKPKAVGLPVSSRLLDGPIELEDDVEESFLNATITEVLQLVPQTIPPELSLVHERDGFIPPPPPPPPPVSILTQSIYKPAPVIADYDEAAKLIPPTPLTF